jgi:2'-5' RNA ligase
MRVFVAIDLGDEARAAVAAAQKSMAQRVGGSAIRLVHPEHLHVTLAFVDKLADPLVSRFVTLFSETFPQPDFEMVFGGLGVFPAKGAPRALWLGIARGAEETVNLQRLVAERLQQMGIEPERRPFHPHLTLARWRDSRPSDRPRGSIDERAVVTTHVKGVTTYQSRPTSAGPSYTVLAEALLRAGRPPH